MQATPRVRVGGETSDPNCQRASTRVAYLQAGRHVGYAVNCALVEACAYCLKGVGEYERIFWWTGRLGHHAGPRVSRLPSAICRFIQLSCVYVQTFPKCCPEFGLRVFECCLQAPMMSCGCSANELHIFRIEPLFRFRPVLLDLFQIMHCVPSRDMTTFAV